MVPNSDTNIQVIYFPVSSDLSYLGLFPLVVMRFLQNVFYLNLKSSYWREGIVFMGSKSELVLIEWQKHANVIRVVYRTSRAKAYDFFLLIISSVFFLIFRNISLFLCCRRLTILLPLQCGHTMLLTFFELVTVWMISLLHW